MTVTCKQKNIRTNNELMNIDKLFEIENRKIFINRNKLNYQIGRRGQKFSKLI